MDFIKANQNDPDEVFVKALLDEWYSVSGPGYKSKYEYAERAFPKVVTKYRELRDSQ